MSKKTTLIINDDHVLIAPNGDAVFTVAGKRPISHKMSDAGISTGPPPDIAELRVPKEKRLELAAMLLGIEYETGDGVLQLAHRLDRGQGENL